jgi:hypothetical protein
VSEPRTIKLTMRAGAHCWTIQRPPAGAIEPQFVMAFLFAVFAVALLATGLMSVLLLPAHLMLKAADRPGILWWDVSADGEPAKPVCPKCGTAGCLEDKAADW